MTFRPAAGALALAAALAGAGAAGSSPDAVRGTYRLHGTAHVEARPALDDDVEVHADAILRPGPGPRDVRARLSAEAQSCDLDAKLGDGGALVFAEGQRCVVDLQAPDARGRIEARLRSGTGRIRDGQLALEMTWDLSGALSVRTATSRIQVLGREVDLPATWMPEVPVRGDAHATVEGRRDASRAAQQ
jgi:hypothetical protein